LGPSRYVPTGKRPTKEIVDCIGKVTLVPNLSCLFSTRTNIFIKFDIFIQIDIFIIYF